MNDKPPIVIGQLTPEDEAARNALRNAEFDELRARYGKRKDETVLIPFQNAVKGSRTPWALEAIHEIYDVAQKQLLAYKDGSVDVTLGGENLRVKARKIPKRDEYQLWVAEPSLPALGRLMVARREAYRQENTPHDETYTPDSSSALFEEMLHRRNDYPSNTAALADSNTLKQVYAQTAPAFPKPTLARATIQPKKNEIYYERDVMRDDLNRALTEKMKNPANQGSEAFSSAADFKRVIDAALQDIASPHSDDKESPIHNFDNPFGLEQMQLFRDIIKGHINGSPSASAGFTVLIHAIDEVMEQYWEVRPLGVRTQANAGHAK